ncbi:hypothetical protein P7K49_021431 [Saguinus oedipus]|uniref:Uncharacterized protein n=1 Tax=Saguinus oedipus TaxID=9490 RepID=A0ABQ9USM2_SAGOE|nr:hypothetical protein P7K49_021431 [Saguinus oedipus]
MSSTLSPTDFDSLEIQGQYSDINNRWDLPDSDWDNDSSSARLFERSRIKALAASRTVMMSMCVQHVPPTMSAHVTSATRDCHHAWAQDMPPRTVTMPVYTGHVPPRTVTMPVYTGHVPPRTVTMPVYTGHVPPRTVTMPVYTGHVPPRTVTMSGCI